MDEAYSTIKASNLCLIHQSHASIIVRSGAVLFGLGYIGFLAVELITILENEPGDPCYQPVRAASSLLMIVFVALQASLIVFYPRLNLHINGVIDRFGCMHVLATNLNMWLHVVVKESITEINHASHEQDEHAKAHLSNSTSVEVLKHKLSISKLSLKSVRMCWMSVTF